MNTRFLRFLVFLFLYISVLSAQPRRIVRPIDPGHVVVLRGNSQPRATIERDQGPADPEMLLTGITLMLRPTPEQQQALERLLEDQRDPQSPEYRKWLSPDEFGDRFGLNPDDMDRLTAWVETNGLHVDYIARSRAWLVLSGTAAQVKTAFRTEVHRYRVDNELHYANASDPAIPAALERVVLGIRGLDDFRPQPRYKIRSLPADGRYTSGSTHSLAPGDISTIYNVQPLYGRGITGTGQRLVVVGQTDFNLSDIRTFRQTFGLAAMDPQVILVPGSKDPGTITSEVAEAVLDVEWTGAIAQNAQIVFVNSTNVYNSLQYAIDQVLAPVISMSYGYCEPQISSNPSATGQAIRALAQQANASGITWMAASGDSGAADCDTGSSATTGLSVDLPGSVPEVTSVGGTEFNEGGGDYFSATNGANGGSAKSYIPEMVWNDTATRNKLLGGGGGQSILFTKPSWQTGPGVPNDGARDVPDISFAASPDHDGFRVVLNGATGIFGGTSVAAPVFAGMVSLLNQAQMAAGGPSGLGNINPKLYSLAQTAPYVFHDVTVGSNAVPCTAGSTGCTSGSIGYGATQGYDRASGLGSIDLSSLASAWGGQTLAGSTTLLTANPATIGSGGSTLLTATVTAASGGAVPSGNVNFTVNGTALGTVGLTGATSVATASLQVSSTQLAAGANLITAAYAGNSLVSASSGTVTVTVTTSHVPTTLAASGGTPQPATVGAAFATALQAIVRDQSGTPMGGVTVTFSAPSSGASAVLSSTTALTNASGIASVSATANRTAGTYHVTASVGSLSAVFTLTNVATGGTGANLAAGKTASESSTLPGVSFAGAQSAIDGNTDGVFYDGSVSTTNLETNPWWQVDLGASASLTSIAVYNRTDCCGSRLSDYWVFVSDTPFAASDTPATLQFRAGTWSSHQTVAPSPMTAISGPAQGRYVRVQLSGTNYLSLAEVVLTGTQTGTPGTNIAQGKPAAQSSTLPGYPAAGAQSAADGNTDGSFYDGSVSTTDLESSPWWQTDLGASATLSSIVIYNRTDCCGSRLNDYWVFVSDTPFGPTDTPATLQFRGGTWSSHQTTAPNPSTVIAAATEGRYVRVQLSGTNYLSLAEVQVIGTGGAASPANVAPGKTAAQSSTLPGYATAGAASAVDGNTNGNFFDGTVTATNFENNAWWQVDLGAAAAISTVTIWNRTDCCGTRLNDYWVFVSYTPFLPGDTPATLQFRSGVVASHQTTAPSPATAIPMNATGRYVRVQLSGADYLSLAEVQVFAQ